MDKLTQRSIERCDSILQDEMFEYNDAYCVVLSDAEECYRLGYKEAIDDVCNWLKNWAGFSIDEATGTLDENNLIERLRKSIEV